MSEGAYRDDLEAAAARAEAVERERARAEREPPMVATAPRPLPASVQELIREKVSGFRMNAGLFMMMIAVALVVGAVEGAFAWSMIPACVLGLLASLFWIVGRRVQRLGELIAAHPELIETVRATTRAEPKGFPRHLVAIGIRGRRGLRLEAPNPDGSGSVARALVNELDAWRERPVGS